MEPGVPVPGTTPRTVTSKRRIVYRESTWKVHQFEVSSEPTGRVVALNMSQSLLLWVGEKGSRRLGAVALGVPATGVPAAGGALATALLVGGGAGEGEAAAGLARRAAAALRRPVFACGAPPYDRFSAPLLERALAAEMRRRPEWFTT